MCMPVYNSCVCVLITFSRKWIIAREGELDGQSIELDSVCSECYLPLPSAKWKHTRWLPCNTSDYDAVETLQNNKITGAKYKVFHFKAMHGKFIT